MTQFVYLVKKHSANTFEIVGNVLEPKESPVLDFLDQLAGSMGANLDERLSLRDIGGNRTMDGRLLPGDKITLEILRETLDQNRSVSQALISCFQKLANQPEVIFERAPAGKQVWHIVREILELRVLLAQASAKRGFYIALCHD